MSRVSALSALEIAAALCVVSLPSAWADPLSGVSVQNLETPGAFEVTNGGPKTELAFRVRLQRLHKGVWTDIVADVGLHSACETRQPTRCVELGAGQTLRPLAWTGFSCGGQCPASCRANILAAPGEYRFGVQACDGGAVVYGATFEWRR